MIMPYAALCILCRLGFAFGIAGIVGAPLMLGGADFMLVGAIAGTIAATAWIRTAPAPT